MGRQKFPSWCILGRIRTLKTHRNQRGKAAYMSVRTRHQPINGVICEDSEAHMDFLARTASSRRQLKILIGLQLRYLRKTLELTQATPALVS